MTNPETPYTTILTQRIVANELALVIQPHPPGSFFISDGYEREDSNSGWPATTSRRVSNVTHYLSDEPYIEIEFLDGTPKRTVRPSETVEVHSIPSLTLA